MCLVVMNYQKLCVPCCYELSEVGVRCCYELSEVGMCLVVMNYQKLVCALLL